MSTSIAPLSVSTAALQPVSAAASAAPDVDRSTTASASVAPTSRIDSAPSSASTSLDKHFSFDRTGLMVVRTIDSTSQEVVAQMPTEAYLRLAQALTETVQAESRTEPSSGVLA